MWRFRVTRIALFLWFSKCISVDKNTFKGFEGMGMRYRTQQYMKLCRSGRVVVTYVYRV
jgi:hypothetical protein